MKAITLRQPFASLVAIGAKTVETRPCATAYRGPVAIQAAPGPTPVQDPYYRMVLAENALDPDALPTGVILALAHLADCTEIVPATCPCYPEYAFGEFKPGWYAWQLTDVRPLDPPLAAAAGQGLWEWHG